MRLNLVLIPLIISLFLPLPELNTREIDTQKEIQQPAEEAIDARQATFYNVAEDKWEPLAASYNRSVHTAMEIAAKRQPVELLSLPVGRLVSQ